jgi:hypothetical protein
MSKTLFDGLSLTVEVGFSTTAGPNTLPNSGVPMANITWTDITEYVLEVSTTRGRSSELDTYNAGSCSVKLDNWNRVFDPDYASGPYYGKLTPLRPLRIRATSATATTYDVFFGYVDEWPQVFSNNWDGAVTVTASDAFKILNTLELPSVWNDSVAALAPFRWFRMSDFNGSFYVFDVANWNGTSAQWMSSTGGGAASFCVPGPSLLVGESSTSSSFDGTKFVQAVDCLGINNVTPMLSAWTVEMWIQTTEQTTGNYAIWNHGDFIHGGAIGMVVSGGNATIVGQFGHRGTSSTMVTKNVQVTVNDGRPHHVMMFYRSDPSLGTSQEIYVDGVSTATTGGFTDIVEQGYFWMTLGSPVYKSLTASNNFTEYFNGSIQDVVVYGDRLDVTYAEDHYEIGAGTYRQGERTDLRIDRLLDYANWPADGSDLATGDSTVLGMVITGKNALAALKEMEVAEQGRLFMSGAGKVKFVDRNGLGSGTYTTVEGQFDDLALTDVSHGISYTDIVFSYDDRFIFNDVTASQPNGSFHQVQDTTSQSQYLKRSSTIDNLVVDTAYLLTNTAVSRLAQYKQPASRVESLTVDGRLEPSKQGSILDFDIGYRITVIRTPVTGPAINKELIIEGIKHTFTPTEWTVQFETSPTNESPFVLDSTLLGVLDTNILGY